MVGRRLLMIPLALAMVVGAWFGVGYAVSAKAPDLGPAVVLTPGPAEPSEPAPEPSNSDPSKPGPPKPRPSEATPVEPPLPRPAGDCDPDDDPGDEDWCGPGYGDEDDDD